MSSRTLFLMVGAAWGLIFGGLAGEAAFMLIYGVGWLPIVGGDTGSEGTNWTLAALPGLLIFSLCLVAGWRFGVRADTAAANQPRVRQAGLGLLGLSVAILVGIAALSQIERDPNVAKQGPGNSQDAALANSAKALHTIDRIDFFGWNAGAGSAGIVMRGNRSGDYRLTWQVIDPASGQVLADGAEQVFLGSGRRTVVIPLARDGLIDAYRDKVLKGAGGVVVDAPFRLAATVEPIPGPEEGAAPPEPENQTPTAGKSPLPSAIGTDFPMSFQVPNAPAVQTD